MRFETAPDYEKLQAENEAEVAKDIASEHDYQLLKRHQELADMKAAIVGFVQEEIAGLAATLADRKGLEQALAMAANPEVVESTFVDGPTSEILRKIERAYPGIMTVDETRLAKREWSAEPWYEDFQEAIRRQVRKDVLKVLESKAGEVGNDIEKANAFEKLVGAVETGATRSVAAAIEDPTLRAEVQDALEDGDSDMAGKAKKLEDEAMAGALTEIDGIFERIAAEGRQEKEALRQAHETYEEIKSHADEVTLDADLDRAFETMTVPPLPKSVRENIENKDFAVEQAKVHQALHPYVEGALNDVMASDGVPADVEVRLVEGPMRAVWAELQEAGFNLAADPDGEYEAQLKNLKSLETMSPVARQTAERNVRMLVDMMAESRRRDIRADLGEMIDKRRAGLDKALRQRQEGVDEKRPDAPDADAKLAMDLRDRETLAQLDKIEAALGLRRAA